MLGAPEIQQNPASNVGDRAQALKFGNTAPFRCRRPTSPVVGAPSSVVPSCHHAKGAVSWYGVCAARQ